MRQLNDLKELLSHFPELQKHLQEGMTFGQLEMYGLSKKDLKKLEHRGYTRRGYLMLPKGMQVLWFLGKREINAE